MTDTPHWEREPSGPESMWRGEKGDKGDPGMTAGAKRAVVFLFAFGIIIAAVSLIYTTRIADHLRLTEVTQAQTVVKLDRLVHKLRREARSQCRFDADLAGLPVAGNHAARKPAELGVKIVSDSRVAWDQAGCAGRLPPASSSFARWAKFYHLPTG